MQPHRIEDYIQTITTFHFHVFSGEESSDYLYDATIEQCCNYVWKKTHGTAHFSKMTEFDLKNGVVKHIDLAVVKAVKNIYINGHEEDPGVRSKRLRAQQDEIAKFKNKNKLK